MAYTSPYSSPYGGSNSRKKKKQKQDKNAKLLALAQELGLDKSPEVAKPKDNFLTKLGKIVDAPRQALTNAYSYATGSKRTRGDKSIFDAMGKGFTSQREINIADILEDSGMGDEKLTTIPFLNKDISARDILGFAGDVVADPLNLVGIGVAGKAAKLAGKAGDAAVALNKAGRAAQKSHISQALKAGKTETIARQEFADLVRQSPEMLKKYEDLGGIKFAGKTVVKGRDIAKGFDKTKSIPVAGKLVEGTANAATDAANLFHKGFKAKQAAPEGAIAVNVASAFKAARNAAHDEGAKLTSDMARMINKVKPKGMSFEDADQALRIARQDPAQAQPWMKAPLEEFGRKMDELHTQDDPFFKLLGNDDDKWYQDNYFTTLFKADKAQVEDILSKYAKANNLKNDPSFFKKKTFQGTIEDIVQFAKAQGVDLKPAGMSEAYGARARMSKMMQAKYEAGEGFKAAGVMDDTVIPTKDAQAQAIQKQLIDRQIKNPKQIANAESKRKEIGILLKNKRDELAAAANKKNIDPDKIIRLRNEEQRLAQQYAIHAQAADITKASAKPKSVEDLVKPSSNVEDYMPSTPVRDYTGASTGRPTPALAALAEKANEFTDADDFIEAISKKEIDMDMLKAAQKEMLDEGLIAKGEPKQTLYDFFAGATGQPRKFDKDGLEKKVDEYLMSFMGKDDVRRGILSGDVGIDDVNKLKTIFRKSKGDIDAVGLAEKFNKTSKVSLDQLTDDLVSRGIATDSDDAIAKMLDLPTRADTTAPRIPEMDRLDEINRSERYAKKLMQREQRKYESEVNKLKLQQSKQINALADKGLVDADTVKLNEKIVKETNPALKGYISVPDVPELKDFKFQPDVAKFIHEEMTKVGKPAHPLLKALDIAMGAWKGSVTTLFPAFHARNKVGNNFNMWLGGFYNEPLKAGKLQTKVAKEFIKHPNMKGMEFVDDFGEKWTPEKLRKLGIMGGQAEVEGTIAEKTLNKVFKAGREIGKRVEDPDRIAFFLQQRAMGKSVDEAVAHVNKFLFNYGNQTDMVKNIGRVVPFFTWTANNLPLQVEQLLKQPHKYNHVMKLYQNVGGEDTENLPDYLKEGMYFAGNKTTNADGEESMNVLRNIGIPMDDLSALNRGGFERTFEREVLGRLPPGVKAMAENATGRDFFRGENTEDLSSQYAYGIRNYPKFLRDLVGYQESEGGTMANGEKFINRSVDTETFKLLDSLGLSRALGTIFPAGGEGSNPVNNAGEIAAKGMIPATSSEFNLSDEKEKRDKEMLERLVKLMVKEGKLREYTNYYEPKTDEEKAEEERKKKKKTGPYATASR